MQDMVWRPAARVEVNGLEITTRLINPDDERKSVLISLSVTDEAGLKADTVDITIDDRDHYVSAAKGDELRVWLGYEPSPVYMGRYKVATVKKSGPRRIMTVSAKSAELTGAFRAPKSRSHHRQTLGEIARKIAGEHGLTPIIDPVFDALAIPHIDQQSESDLAFLTRLASRAGATFKVADGSLLLAKKGKAALPSGSILAPQIVAPGDVESWDWESNGRGDFSAVATRYRNPATGVAVHVTAGDAASASMYRDRRLYGSMTEAEAAASAQLEDFARGKVTATIEASLGLPNVFAGGEVVLKGFDREMDATYRVKSVKHRLDDSGYRSSLELEIGAGGLDA